MVRPLLPSYSSPENTHFHPPFKAAMEDVLSARGLSHIVVKQQYPSPTGPIDLVLYNTLTKKVLLPIELKRSQSSVRGGGRRQARDYWTNLGSGCESKFYCASNLELTELFRFDAHRPKTSAQRILLQNPIAGKLGLTPESDFYDQLIIGLNEILDLVTGVASHSYATAGLPEFQLNIESSITNPSQWHQLFVPVCFEYIRGAATRISQLRPLSGGWKEASFFNSAPNRLLDLGKLIDFEHIFKNPAPNPNDPLAFAQAVLKEAYESGKELGNGDDIAEIVNEILAPSGLGIVETDVELAQLLAITARDALGRELTATEEVLDPASGSGRLLTALPLTAFPAISPKQIKANEKEILFAESLSLRLGLTFASVISPLNAPSVSISGIELIDPAYLEKVRVIVMNPPYLSGVQSVTIKGLFTNRIRTITGADPFLNIGQVALEILFLELVWHLAQEGTVIATVFPYQHLCRPSAEVVAFRQFLATKFALTHIVIYPRTGLFEDVIKQTVLLIGVKGASGSAVKVVEVQKQVGDLDMAELLSNLTVGSATPTHGVSIRSVPRIDLIAAASEGWKGIIGSGTRTVAFMDKYMSGFRSVESRGIDVTRGCLGNQGNTPLTVFNPSLPKYPTVIAKIPTTWIRPALNSSKNMPRILNSTSAPQGSFLPPASAYNQGHQDNLILNSIVQEFQAVEMPRSGSQAVAIKSVSQIFIDLKGDQVDQGADCVLIQRASRTKGEVGLVNSNGILISTNLLIIKVPEVSNRELMASWFLSVFGQLQLELYGTSQEGMRKLEVSSIKNVLSPNIDSIELGLSSKLRRLVKSEPAILFNKIQHRETDVIWAEIVDPTSPAECLAQAFELFQELVDDRKGFGGS